MISTKSLGIVVFSGPTINKVEVQKHLPGAEWFKPAAQGDLLSVYFKYNPKSIVLIDGFYENVPSVLHKEILFIMARGVSVVGAGSLGALRASELSDFGMIGIGEVYNAFVTGLIEDDDEVALIHAPEDLFYLPLSLAMVNIRWSLDHAHNCGIITFDEKVIFLDVAKNVFYKDRLWDRIVSEKILGSRRPDVLNWLKTNQVDIKKRDAICALEFVNKKISYFDIPKAVAYNFESTIFFEKVLNDCSQ